MQTIRNLKESYEIWKDNNLINSTYLDSEASHLFDLNDSILVLKTNESAGIAYNYSYVFRSDVDLGSITRRASLSSYNKVYFRLPFDGVDFSDEVSSGLNRYVHWDIIHGADIPDKMLSDTWAPDAILYSNGEYVNLNANPDKQISTTTFGDDIKVYSSEPVDIELREFSVAYVDGEESDEMRLADVESGTEISLETNHVIGINGVRTTAYAAFALIAVMILVAAAFGIVAVFNQGADLTQIMTVAIWAIGAAIVLMVGYIIISAVAGGLI